MIFKNTAIINGPELCSELTQFLTIHKNQYEKDLTTNLSHIDNHAQNTNGIEVQNVTHIDGNKYALEYTYDWQIYRGCLDMTESAIERDKVSFTIDSNGFIVLDILIFDERSTADEL